MIKGFKVEDVNKYIKENDLTKIDTDLYKISDAFKKFAIEEKLDFFE